MNLTAVQATVDDLPQVVAILNDGLRYKSQHGDTAWGSEAWTIEELLPQRVNGEIYLVYKQGETEAIATFTLTWSDENAWGEESHNQKAGYLHKFAMDTNHRGKGYGQHIIQLAGAQVSQKDRNVLRLDCPKENQRLCHYYETVGFQLVGVNTKLKLDAALYEMQIKR